MLKLKTINLRIKNPCVRITLSFICGILLAEYVCCPPYSIALIAIIFSIGLFFIAKKSISVQTICTYICFLLLGNIAYSSKRQTLSVNIPTQKQVYRIVVASNPIPKNKVVQFDAIITEGKIRGKQIKVSILKHDGNAMRKIQIGRGIEMYARITPTCNIKPYKTFDYGSWLLRHGYIGQTLISTNNIRIRTLSLSGISKWQRFKLALNIKRNKILETLNKTGIDGQEYAIIAAMTLGDKATLSKQTKDIYSEAGAAHLLAVSGLHLGIIYFMLTMLLDRRRRSPIAQTVILIAIYGYAALTGLSASVVRAALMVTVYSAAMMMNRERLSLNTLAFAALMILLFNPMSLWDVGFQLSFMAMLGITLFYKPIYELVQYDWLHEKKFIDKVWSITAISLSAQLLTTQLVAYYFNRIACYSLLTNIVIVPIATLMIYLAIVVLIFPQSVNTMFGWLLREMAEWVNESLKGIATLPGATIEGINMNQLQLVIAYAITCCLLWAAYYIIKITKETRRLSCL